MRASTETKRRGGETTRGAAVSGLCGTACANAGRGDGAALRARMRARIGPRAVMNRWQGAVGSTRLKTAAQPVSAAGRSAAQGTAARRDTVSRWRVRRTCTPHAHHVQMLQCSLHLRLQYRGGGGGGGVQPASAAPVPRLGTASIGAGARTWLSDAAAHRVAACVAGLHPVASACTRAAPRTAARRESRCGVRRVSVVARRVLRAAALFHRPCPPVPSYREAAAPAFDWSRGPDLASESLGL